METCCAIISSIVIGYIAFMIWIAIADMNDKKNKRINEIKNEFDAKKNYYDSLEHNIVKTIIEYFTNKEKTLESTTVSLNSLLHEMKICIEDLKRINRKLIGESRRDDRSHIISRLSTIDAENNVRKFEEYRIKTEAIPSSIMIDSNSYGKINKEYYNEIVNLEREEVMSYVDCCNQLINNAKDLDALLTIDNEKLMKCIWFLATEKTYAALDFQKAEKAFSHVDKSRHVDVLVAKYYALKKVGGEEVIRNELREMLKVVYDANKLTTIASSFMWMNAYQCENMILQHMLSTGKEMCPKAQERLHSLTNGGGKAPDGFEVESSDDKLYFDMSSLAWRDDEYTGLFENLSFQDKLLTYSLAIREENKELLIDKGVNVPTLNSVLSKFDEVFEEEYGDNVWAKIVNGVALSGSGEEKMDGIVVSSTDCSQMGVLIHIARIGKKLIIKFYTLFMPLESNLTMQRQQVLSMYKKLSPSVTMWESSLKDTMLMAVEQLLNSSTKVEPVEIDTISNTTENPIF